MTHSNVVPLRPKAWFARAVDQTSAGALAAGRLRADATRVGGHLAPVLGPLPVGIESNARLREDLARFRDLFERSPFGVLVIGFDGRISRINAMAAAYLQRDAQALRHSSLFALCDPESHPRLRAHLEHLATGADFDLCELDMIGADGTLQPMQVATLNVGDSSEGPLRSALIDASGVAEMETGLALASNVVEHTALGIIVTDAQRRVIAVNPAYTAITGFSAQEMLGCIPDFLETKTDSPVSNRARDKESTPLLQWQGELWGHRKTGDAYPQWISISAIADEAGTPTHYVCTLADMTHQEDAKQELRELAYTDSLTGLANRASLLDQLSRSLIAARRRKELVGLLFLDLDRFKTVNDTLGHAVGDRLLKFISKELDAAVRQSDLVARLGGDEFVILLPDLKRTQAAGQVANKILLHLRDNPFREDGRQIHLDASIGIALFPKDAHTSDGLLACADAAMYAAKSGGRNGYRFYSSNITSHHREGDELESDLRGALERRELQLQYQPQVCLKRFRVVGCEALLRWNHTDQGTIAPERFLPLAERTELIVPLSRWALRKAAVQTRYWREQAGGVRMSFDLSPVQLQPAHIEGLMSFLAERAGAFPDGLEFEINESILGEESERYLDASERLRALGFGIVLDNFGAGQFSLTRIKKLPLTRVKLSAALIHDLEADPDIASVVDALIKLAHQLGIKVLAQGVETPEQLEFLRTHHCDEAQGNLLSQPLQSGQFMSLLRRSIRPGEEPSERGSRKPFHGLLGTAERAWSGILARLGRTAHTGSKD